MSYNPFSLSGKTILVTGASSGIGRATAIECSRLGATLIITGRNEERLNDTFQQLEGNNHIQIIADFSKTDGIPAFVEKIPVLDGCVNNAGIVKTLLIQFITEEIFDGLMKVNTYAPILLTQLLLKKKKFQKNASIVFTSSVSGVFVGASANSMYSASKGAISGFAKSAAMELAPKKIRVNTVCAGMINTRLLDEGIISQEQLEEDLQFYPLKRYGQPEDVAFGIIYLLSDASSWVTGTNLLIDGGITLL
jgi:NAD(P)-dependent dehydrogenase (short-subunit alcohol dehydrogenase family)